jgi:prepilin-type N-terminal cleavage/methylation domain-containing protein/prepilin-type processing-associated H-X9-DG protein
VGTTDRFYQIDDRRRPARGGRAAFSLTELLVVIGIIAVLIAILLPAVGKLRESARRTVCLSHIRTLTQATLAYAADNDRVLPEAVSTNSFQDPLSPRVQGTPWHPVQYIPNAYVLPTIGGLLSKYVGPDTSVWRCPDSPEDPSVTAAFVVTGADPYSGNDPGVLNVRPGDEFRPSYSYESYKDYFAVAATNSVIANQNQLRAWIVRSVSGLRIERAVPVSWSNQAVVLFHDRDSTYHSEGHVNIYMTPGDWPYYANYGYLDGHAEGHSYHNVTEYLAQMHGPIPQHWFGQDFQQVFPEQYVPPH